MDYSALSNEELNAEIAHRLLKDAMSKGIVKMFYPNFSWIDNDGNIHNTKRVSEDANAALELYKNLKKYHSMELHVLWQDDNPFYVIIVSCEGAGDVTLVETKQKADPARALSEAFAQYMDIINDGRDIVKNSLKT